MAKPRITMLGLIWMAGCAVVTLGQAAQPAAAPVVRAIDDAATRTLWLLERDPNRPGGPGRLIAAERRRENTALKNAPAAPVIRAGDHLVVEQSTPILDARLTAIALNPAAAGSPLQVRLVIGGRVMAAVALGPGRAQLLPQEGQP